MIRFSRLLACAALFFALGAPSLTRADRATRNAKRHYSSATRLFDAGQYDRALKEYQRAYKLKPLPGFLFNFGQCYRKMGEHEQAIQAYRDYLEKSPKAPNREIVLGLIRESEAQIAPPAPERETPTGAAAAVAPAANTEAETDDASKAPDTAAPTPDDTKSPRRASDHARAVVNVPDPGDADEGPEADANEARAVANLTESPSSRAHPLRTWTYVGAGTGGALVAGGVVFGLLTRSAQSAFDGAGCGDPAVSLSAAQIAQCRSDQATGERNALLSNVFLGAGGALLAGSVVVYLLDPGHAEASATERTARVNLTPTSVSLTVTW